MGASGPRCVPTLVVSFWLWVFSLSVVWLYHLRYHGCLGLSSFIKGSAVSESLWCFLSRGGSTLLQRVHEGERMYPPLGSTGWWEPGNQTHNHLLPTGIQTVVISYENRHKEISLHTGHAPVYINIDSCQVSTACITEFQSVFSRDKLDCGKATGYLHWIRTTELLKPFQLPCLHVPPTHNERLRQVLDEIEEWEIIRKSSSQFAFPLVLVWKKSGVMRVCNDFH